MAEKKVIELIQTLRGRTGAGMMDCKKALEENGLDIEKAIDWLREKGIAKQAKRAGRVAAEGATSVRVCPKCGKGVIAEVNCETDFVANSDKFRGLVNAVLSYLMDNEPKDIEEARAATQKDFGDAGIAVGEKLELRRFQIVHKGEGHCLGSYIHMGGKISVLVELEKEDEKLANDLAMTIAANAPLYLGLEDVPAADRERELGIAKTEVANDPKLINKPENVKATIAERKADKALSAYCFLLQDYLLDPSKKVGDVLKEKGNKIVRFVRYALGDGIQKDQSQEN